MERDMKSILIHSLRAVILCLAVTPAVHAESETDLTTLPLESLMELRVTSVSKKSQLLADAAAAIFVITQDDIRRSGATTIPDLLRMVPGVQVARIDSSKWAISSRGLNGRFSNKLLVLQDGRSLYTPLFAGVYWEVQDTIMEDIERIEVIRGPGAALWGANAVNGVINIITKSAENTRGGLISAGGGTSERGFGTVRYGTNVGDNSSLRLYAKHLERGPGLDATGNDTHDAWQMTRGGFRLDAKPTQSDSLTLQGEYYDGSMQETYKLYSFPTPPSTAFSQNRDTETTVSGGNILARWQRNLQGSDSLSLQLYYDHNQRNMIVLPQKLDTLDLDFQHRFSTFAGQDIVWGLGYRFGHYDVSNTPTLSFLKQEESNHLFSAFVHDEIALIPEKLSLILGARFERNDYTGFEIQPNGRILWTPSAGHTLWGAVSRAVRTATRGEQDIQYRYRTLSPTAPENPTGLPLRLEIDGSRDFKSEELLAYEIGYRVEPAARLSMDIALYYNIYKHLRVLKPGAASIETPPGAGPNAVQQFILSNDMHGSAYGAEISADWLPCPWWRLQATYSFERLTMHLDGTSTDTINRGNAQGDTPRHQASLRTGFDLGRQVTLDLWLRGTDYLASIDGVSIPGSITMDARLAWKPLRNLELSLVGQNLFDRHHPEFIPEYINTVPSEVVRSVYGKLTWKF
jgi:iron complex outermembrane recepter protein